MVMEAGPRATDDAEIPPLGERIRQALRGCLAVLLLILTGIDALITAVIGVRPLAPVLSQLGHVLADEYRAGSRGYLDADVITDPDEMEP